MPDSLVSLTFLLLTVARARKVHPDGIRYEGLRYVDTILAAYVGESVTLWHDPRDMAEICVFHKERFICRAICPELEGATVLQGNLARQKSAPARTAYNPSRPKKSRGCAP